MMPALARWALPIPLGGTSNHFRTRSLREMGGWDAYNVTEDADLGVRLARLRYRTGMLPSATYEEAPLAPAAWLRQRTRWMKGWMQTFVVHNRHPVQLWRDLGWRGWLGFEVYVGSLILSPFLHVAFMLGIGLALLSHAGPFAGLINGRSSYWWAIVAVGYSGSLAVSVAGLLRLGQKRLLVHQLLSPLYWVFHAVAMVQAVLELMNRPHFWAKTRHGLTKIERSFGTAGKVTPAGARIGRPASAVTKPWTRAVAFVRYVLPRMTSSGSIRVTRGSGSSSPEAISRSTRSTAIRETASTS
jgi:cellulose synthase/poly-beta-1,6-N-acetylglucosamine synthase-like glycosyltransferase